MVRYVEAWPMFSLDDAAFCGGHRGYQTQLFDSLGIEEVVHWMSNWSGEFWRGWGKMSRFKSAWIRRLSGIGYGGAVGLSAWLVRILEWRADVDVQSSNSAQSGIPE